MDDVVSLVISFISNQLYKNGSSRMFHDSNYLIGNTLMLELRTFSDNNREIIIA